MLVRASRKTVSIRGVLTFLWIQGSSKLRGCRKAAGEGGFAAIEMVNGKLRKNERE